MRLGSPVHTHDTKLKKAHRKEETDTIYTDNAAYNRKRKLSTLCKVL